MRWHEYNPGWSGHGGYHSYSPPPWFVRGHRWRSEEEYLEDYLQGLEREIAEVRARLEEIRRSRGRNGSCPTRDAA